MSDTIEPTEAEASVLAELFSTTRRQSNLAILRAHVAAEVAKATGELLAADCAWPVEARFLAACVDALPDERRFAGPYPLMEISTWMMAAGQDPMKTHARLESELPQHNPLADARQSARLLMEAIEVTKREWPKK